jgi:hypothetical protein
LLSKAIKIKVCRTIVLALVLYRSETLPLTLKEERGVKVSESTVHRNTLGPKRDQRTEEWRTLHNEGLYYLYSQNIIRVIKSRMRREGHVARKGVHTGFGGET